MEKGHIYYLTTELRKPFLGDEDIEAELELTFADEAKSERVALPILVVHHGVAAGNFAQHQSEKQPRASSESMLKFDLELGTVSNLTQYGATGGPVYELALAADLLAVIGAQQSVDLEVGTAQAAALYNYAGEERARRLVDISSSAALREDVPNPPFSGGFPIGFCCKEAMAGPHRGYFNGTFSAVEGETTPNKQKPIPAAGLAQAEYDAAQRQYKALDALDNEIDAGIRNSEYIFGARRVIDGGEDIDEALIVGDFAGMQTVGPDVPVNNIADLDLVARAEPRALGGGVGGPAADVALTGCDTVLTGGYFTEAYNDKAAEKAVEVFYLGEYGGIWREAAEGLDAPALTLDELDDGKTAVGGYFAATADAGALLRVGIYDCKTNTLEQIGEGLGQENTGSQEAILAFTEQVEGRLYAAGTLFDGRLSSHQAADSNCTSAFSILPDGDWHPAFNVCNPDTITENDTPFIRSLKSVAGLHLHILPAAKK